MFGDNFRAKMKELKLTAKEVANAMEKAGYPFGGKQPYRIVQSWMAKNAYLPNVEGGYAIARALGTTVEELVDGPAGAEYVLSVVRNIPRAVQVPDRLFSIVENLMVLDEKELVGIRASAKALAEAKEGK
jgi:hypothetical protein